MEKIASTSEILENIKRDKEFYEVFKKAEQTYKENFNGEAWFGRCIFLSWYCDRGTCDFCFRSVQKHKIKFAESARRSVASVVSEAALIKGMGWHLEFLTGGYGIYPFPEIVRMAKICSQIIGRKIWVNLGSLEESSLIELKPYVEGIVSSLETLEPVLHKKVCPDKPIEPYLEMVNVAKKHGFKQSFTLVIGLNEKREDFSYVKDLIEKYQFDRITIYALRPVAGTPYTHGPAPEEVIWWIAKVRENFPKIEIIAGTAIYRIDEISLILRAGANAFTKLPATKLFNTSYADDIYSQVNLAERNLTSRFSEKDIASSVDWRKMIWDTDLSEEEKEESYKTLQRYLTMMHKHQFDAKKELSDGE